MCRNYYYLPQRGTVCGMRNPVSKEKRTSTLLLRMTPSEREAIEKAAADAGQSMSEYLLRAAGLRGPGAKPP
jgi:hypothetical protein